LGAANHAEISQAKKDEIVKYLRNEEMIDHLRVQGFLGGLRLGPQTLALLRGENS
jgi:hypothetical protein